VRGTPRTAVAVRRTDAAPEPRAAVLPAPPPTPQARLARQTRA
jgi:hypothetical protein